MQNSFNSPIIPDNEEARLAELRSLKILDTYEEQGPFKHIVAIASRLFKVPIALVNLVDKNEVVTMANVGMDGVRTVPRDVSLCSLAILKDGVTVFEDARQDPCVLANPLVVGDFGLQFYAGAPLKTANGYHIGALCIVDREPREFQPLTRKCSKAWPQW